ncbi:MAG: hypothetical protein EBT89_02960, partial [Opitutaceae bacterium]|nr:hypothetical protein [Opitutaceae bacterium]
FKTRLYGKFVKPHTLFQTSMQTSLALAYQNVHDAKPLAFRLGYDKTSGSSVVVAASPMGLNQVRLSVIIKTRVQSVAECMRGYGRTVMGQLKIK